MTVRAAVFIFVSSDYGVVSVIPLDIELKNQEMIEWVCLSTKSVFMMAAASSTQLTRRNLFFQQLYFCLLHSGQSRTFDTIVDRPRQRHSHSLLSKERRSSWQVYLSFCTTLCRIENFPKLLEENLLLKRFLNNFHTKHPCSRASQINFIDEVESSF